MTRYVFVTAPPSKSLRNLLKQSILQKNDDLMETVNEKLVEKNRLLKTELKIQKTLKDLKQEKRKIFSLIASNMKKKKKEVVWLIESPKIASIPLVLMLWILQYILMYICSDLMLSIHYSSTEFATLLDKKLKHPYLYPITKNQSTKSLSLKNPKKYDFSILRKYL